jgi:hypothetical protein
MPRPHLLEYLGDMLPVIQVVLLQKVYGTMWFTLGYSFSYLTSTYMSLGTYDAPGSVSN